MKITVVSNCQGEGLAHCLEQMNPEIVADFCIVTNLQNGTRKIDDILAGCDFLFTQNSILDSVPPEFSHKVFYFPSIAFSAFHPDMTYLRGRRKGGNVETVESLMVIYHSSIAVFGYLHGIPVDQILGFYNPYVFSRLGYIDGWDESRKLLMDEGLKAGMPLNFMFQKWEKLGCFMYSFNHPSLAVISDVAIALLKKAKIPVKNYNCSQFIQDPLRAMPVWPVYPQIAARFGLDGDYAFKRAEPHGVVDLRTFVENSYANYDNYERDSLEPLNFSIDDFNRRLDFSKPLSADKEIDIQSKRSLNPYADIPAHQFWKKSLVNVPIEEVDPVTEPKFKVDQTQKVATAGSCFAQHIARTLKSNGFNYFVTESAPGDMDAETAHLKNYGVFSARYGNIYTVRQLVQLFDRVYGFYKPEDEYWIRKDGKFIDPFRPQIEPDGFVSVEAAEKSRNQHFSAVRSMLQEMDVFIFTLGLTEGWRSRHDGAIFPVAPGVVGVEVDESRYEFINFTSEEASRDLEKFMEQLATVNPKCKVILTVSPVPLVATYEPQHALVATTYSKAVLRVTAEHARTVHSNVEYFPSYEIITGSFNQSRYFQDDLRTVTDEGVAHVMRLFLKHYIDSGGGSTKLLTSDEHVNRSLQHVSNGNKSLFDIICDEEAIAKI